MPDYMFIGEVMLIATLIIIVTELKSIRVDAAGRFAGFVRGFQKMYLIAVIPLCLACESIKRGCELLEPRRVLL